MFIYVCDRIIKNNIVMMMIWGSNSDVHTQLTQRIPRKMNNENEILSDKTSRQRQRRGGRGWSAWTYD